MKKVVILGAGFAGLQIARRIKNKGFEIILIDQYNFHQFQPLFYQVATGRLEPSAISFPLRKVFQGARQVHIRITKVKRIDEGSRKVITEDGAFDYDYLILATGCTSNFFGNRNIEKFAFPMKSVNEAIALRNHILLNFEDALSAPQEQMEEIMNIVIAGGGATGLELAGAVAELKKYILPKDYPDMDFSRLKIFLVEGGSHIIPNMSKASQKKSQEYLKQMEVAIMLHSIVQDYDGKTVTFKDGKTLKTRNLIWTAGVTGNIPAGIPETLIVKGRIKVDDYNRVQGTANIFAIGDVAYMETKGYPKGHPQLANVAINQAKNLAGNMDRLLKNQSLRPFIYKNPGTMATIGKHKAVVDLPFISFQGRLAWFTWMFLHLMLILSVKNKLFIFINWAYNYFTNDTTLRLILLPGKKDNGKKNSLTS